MNLSDTEKEFNRSFAGLLTDAEKDVLLNGFRKSDFFDGIDSCVWSNDLESNTRNVKGKSISGVVASLVKKGILVSVGEGKEAYVHLTKAGKEIFLALEEEKIG